MENNDLLTKEEIDILINNIDIPVNDDKIENRLDISFENAYKYFRDNKKFNKISIKDIFKWFYYLGVNTEPDSKEISMEEVMKIIDDKDFIEMVSNCIRNPMAYEKFSVNINAENNTVCLTQNCVGQECPCSPQREDCCKNYGDKCSIIIPMSKFNEMINFKEIE